MARLSEISNFNETNGLLTTHEDRNVWNFPYVNGEVPLPRSTLSSSDPSHNREAGLTRQDIIVKALTQLANLTRIDIQISCFHADLREKHQGDQASSSPLLVLFKNDSQVVA